ncbi:DUF4352 domain-containing protein [Metabacillus iocasae]|uniref:DUF4352 domain-containing protein n=1 Tax=Priestia iocasae TaxID=2291674 RepID=A0ABS2QU25_9BACI|nr:DUF4352 domain-containing protein [Metabacillus iocasae]MBM7702920.1 hypothetical protein [Metabacillus iocasae]
MAKEKVKKPFYKKWWVWVLAVIIIGSIASGGEEEIATTEPKSEEASADVKAETAAAESAKKEEKKAFGIGEEVKVGNLTYVVNAVEETNKISNILGDKTTEGKFVVVELTVKNTDKKARLADTNMFKVLTADETEYSADGTLDMYVNEAGEGFFLQDLNPNIGKTGKVVFELPTEATQYDLQVSSGFGWSGGEYESIVLK